MKRLLPFILIIILQGTAATEMHGAGNISSISLQVPDSMELFQNITDIGRQIEMRIKPVGDSVVYRNPLDSLYSRKEMVRCSCRTVFTMLMRCVG